MLIIVWGKASNSPAFSNDSVNTCYKRQVFEALTYLRYRFFNGVKLFDRVYPFDFLWTFWDIKILVTV